MDEAISDMDAGNITNGKMKIEKAKKMLNEMKTAMKKCLEKMPTCNTNCPISGQKIEMMNCPENLTRMYMYKGKKVGFCCPACPPQRDKLTDIEKNEKLKKVMPKMPDKEKMMKKMDDKMEMKKKDGDMM